MMVVENSDILRDETTKRIKRKPADRGLHAMFAQFLNDAITPLPAKTPLSQIPTAADQGRDQKDRDDAQPDSGSSARSRAPACMCAR